MAAAARRILQLRYVLLHRLLLLAALVINGGVVAAAAGPSSSPPPTLMQTEQVQGLIRQSSVEAPSGGRRRLLVGSRAPTCTYNECRGCRHRCSVREVPVDASDPINSAYHYRCVCHG